jgi:membrane-bound lytic murein transglycosylase B
MMKTCIRSFLLMGLFWGLLTGHLLVPAMAQEKPDNTQPFDQWLSDFKRDALAQGISQQTLDKAFADTAPIDTIIRLDKKQPENKLTLKEYLARVLTDKRIEHGQEAYDEDRELLTRIGNEYGVQPRFIAALWGIETDFGRNTGDFVITDALATLAYDGRRSEFFRGELIDALKILEAENMSAEEMYGSWAGAMGQCQFMPSTFLKHAVDEDKDGRRDVWDNKEDFLASIANYLKSLGWKKDQGWGRPVKLPKGFDMSLADIKKEKSLPKWKKLGVKKADGSPLPDEDISASLILVGEGPHAAPYIIYSNYKALLQWNRSRFFATSVGMLADSLK